MNNNNKNPNPETIGDRIKELRKKYGMTQQALGDRIVINKSSINRWEKGEASPKVEYINELAKILYTSPEYLMYGRNHADDDKYLDLNGLTLYQIGIIKAIVEQFRGSC